MFVTLKHLSLGLLLIAGASALLLFSDLRSRTASASAQTAAAPAKDGAGRQVRVALLQTASQSILDEGREGMIAGLAERGWVVGKNLRLKCYNAEGDISVAQTIAKEMTGGNYDLLLTASTVSLQVVANANKSAHVTHIFGLVTDPYGAGVGISRENHLDHPPWLAGHGTMQPVVQGFQTAREMNPALATVGVVYNAAETNSVAQIALARQICAKLGITLLEASVDNSSAVGEAAGALVARGAEALWLDGDIMVATALDALIAAGRKGRIPVFTSIPPGVERGTLFDLGANYREVGRIAGRLAGDVLDGRSPATVSVENVLPESLMLNYQALAGLKGAWHIPAALRARAQLVIDETGAKHVKPPPAGTAPPSTASAAPGSAPTAARLAPVPGRTYHIAFAYYSPSPGADDCQRGVVDGLAALGFVEGRNLVIARTHAQGEVVNIPSMLRNLDASGAEVIVTFSTPVLQGALTAVKHKPVVFSFVTDPLVAGAGKSYDDHAPHVTGIGSLPPIADTVALIRRVLPNVKTLGTIYNNGEANSNKIISLLREATHKAGIQLVELTGSNPNEVFQAMQALVTRGIDAFYMPSDNTLFQAFDGILRIADNAKIPFIADDAAFAERGALFTAGPGFHDSGVAAAERVARILHGESPADIPFANVSVNTIRFNRDAIARLGLDIDPNLIRELEQGSAAAAATPPPNPTGKKWKIACVFYNETAAVEEALAGMTDAWQRSPLAAGRDYEFTLHSAQGDMAVLGTIVDSVLADGADLVVPLTTPALQAAVQRVRRVPMVFALVADPIVAGAGRTYTDHLPNLTGAPVPAGCDEALALIQKYFPAYRRLGTVFCPAEANSVAVKQDLEAACRRRGFTLDVVAANGPSELPDAALALMTRPIDAVLQITDNLSNAGFTAITRAARQTYKPLFSLTGVSIPYGSAVAVGRDYHRCGEVAVALIERVIRGEDPAQIPFAVPAVTTTASPANAAALGMTLPPALLAEPGLILK